MTSFQMENPGFADGLYGAIDPVVAGSGTGRAPGGYVTNTDTGQNVTAQTTIDVASTGQLWSLKDGVLPWLVILVVAFCLLQARLNK